MRKLKILSLFLVAVLLIASTIMPTFAQTDIQQSSSQPSIQTQTSTNTDNSTVTPMNPKKVVRMKHISTGGSSAEITVEGTPVTPTQRPEIPEGYMMASAVPSYFHFNLWSDDNNLRTITVTVEAVGCLTPILDYSAFLNIRNYNGVCTSSNRLYNSLFYNKTWTFTIPITSTIEENITLQGGSLTHLGKTYTVPDLTITRTNQIGGSYSSMLNAMGGQRHHLIAQQNISLTKISTYDYISHGVTGTVTTGSAPCILMTPEDHWKTASYGGGQAYRTNQLNLLKQGLYLQALQMDIDDIRSKCGHKYDIAINQAYNYALFTLGWYR